MPLKTLISTLATLMLVVFAASATHAAQVVDFKPGALKSAIGNGETVLLHYKSTW